MNKQTTSKNVLSSLYAVKENHIGSVVSEILATDIQMHSHPVTFKKELWINAYLNSEMISWEDLNRSYWPYTENLQDPSCHYNHADT